MRKILMLGWVALLPLPGSAGDEEPYTPKPGSAERTAICDALRAYTRSEYGISPKLKFLWKIEWLRVQGRHASFAGSPVTPDGGHINDESMIGEFETNVCLRREEAGWKVIMDLSRTDLPSKEEIRELRASFPKDMPVGILPEFWRGMLDPAAVPRGVHTPQPGSAVRKAICDEMRAYVRGKYRAPAKLQFLWKIDELKVLDRHATFQGYAVRPDGGFLEDDSMIGDMEFTCFLHQTESGWGVIADLTRGDVPAPEELREIRAGFPKEIPTAILPEFWRDKLR